VLAAVLGIAIAFFCQIISYEKEISTCDYDIYIQTEKKDWQDDYFIICKIRQLHHRTWTKLS